MASDPSLRCFSSTSASRSTSMLTGLACRTSNLVLYLRRPQTLLLNSSLLLPQRANTYASHTHSQLLPRFSAHTSASMDCHIMSLITKRGGSTRPSGSTTGVLSCCSPQK
eukprot:GHRQ01022995.1.p2 GENE.GHRQ01022995.1~~GHRQ01022995.1.p2  ORF type:complete len:110 (-),score=19.71 GHRQ01022995.1:169-498(-)